MQKTELSVRVRPHLAKYKGISERKMFGGTCFTINGNMCVGTWKGALIVRLDKKAHDLTLSEPHTKPADMNGRIMRGWALVEPEGIESDENLAAWIDRAASYAGSLPAK